MRFGCFEFVVMSFKLTNALIMFIDFMNIVFYHCLDKFIVAFIDDILVYSKSHKEYEQHLRFTL